MNQHYQFSLIKTIFNIILWGFFNISCWFIVTMVILLYFKFTGTSAPIHEKTWSLFDDIDFAFNVGFYSLIPANLLYWVIKMKNGKWRNLFFKTIH